MLSAAQPSPTAPAGSRDSSRTMLPKGVVQREFFHLFDEYGLAPHPAEVRALAQRFVASGRTNLGDVETIVIGYADPTGEQAVLNVMKAGGAA